MRQKLKSPCMREIVINIASKIAAKSQGSHENKRNEIRRPFLKIVATLASVVESSEKIYYAIAEAAVKPSMTSEVCFACWQVQRVLISHDNTGPNPEWFLERLTIEVASRGEKYLFASNRWLTGDEDKKVDVEVFPGNLLRSVCV